MLESLTKILGPPEGLNRRLDSRTTRVSLENWWRQYYVAPAPPLTWEDEVIPAEASTDIEFEETTVFRDPVLEEADA